MMRREQLPGMQSSASTASGSMKIISDRIALSDQRHGPIFMSASELIIESSGNPALLSWRLIVHNRVSVETRLLFDNAE
jgi:hypothetical protein